MTTIIAQVEEANSTSTAESPKMWLGGEIAFGNLSNRDFLFGPVFGIMINDKMGVGGTLMYSGGNNSNAWGIGPFFRYYLPVIDKFSFYGDAFLDIGGGDNATNIDGGEYNTLDFGARAGFEYWFTTRWSITASSNVFIYQSTDGNGDFGLGVNFNTVNLSFYFHF